MAQLEINLNHLKENFREFAAMGKVIPVLKGNAYGLGEKEVMDALMEEGITLFAVSRSEEALRLCGRGADILLLGCEHGPEVLKVLVEKGVILAAESTEQIALAASFGEVRVHLAVDTGFGRFGFHPTEVHTMRKVFSMENVKVEGIFSHFRSPESASGQFEAFRGVLDALKGYPYGMAHIAASLNAKNPAYRLDAVRVGTGYTGMLLGQRDVVRLTGRIVSLHDLPKGSKIGYTSHKLKKDTTLAIIDVGTGDGAFLHRSCGPRTWLAMRKRWVRIGEEKVPVLGHPGMTHTAIDVTGLDCRLGDTAVVDQTPVMISPLVERVYVK